MTEPTTKAGRRLIAAMPSEFSWDDPRFVRFVADAILAIEAEASKPPDWVKLAPARPRSGDVKAVMRLHRPPGALENACPWSFGATELPCDCDGHELLTAIAVAFERARRDPEGGCFSDGLREAKRRLSIAGMHDGKCPEPDKACTCGLDEAIDTKPLVVRRWPDHHEIRGSEPIVE